MFYFLVPCIPGTFKWNKLCLKCPIGSYQSYSGSETCHLCDEFKVTEENGATSVHQCGESGLLFKRIYLITLFHPSQRPKN